MKQKLTDMFTQEALSYLRDIDVNGHSWYTYIYIFGFRSQIYCLFKIQIIIQYKQMWLWPWDVQRSRPKCQTTTKRSPVSWTYDSMWPFEVQDSRSQFNSYTMSAYLLYLPLWFINVCVFHFFTSRLSAVPGDMFNGG